MYARSTALRSSRTLPGQSMAQERARKSSDKRLRVPLRRLSSARKKSASDEDVLAALAQRRQLDDQTTARR